MPALYQTPPSTPLDVVCRTLRIPSSLEWLGIFNAAMLTMLNVYNWEQVNDTDLTVDETIALVSAMLIDYWDTQGCTTNEMPFQPGGYALLRLGAGGHVQQAILDEWGAPVGDYAIPPVPEREEPTTYERKCLAAANAANVLYLVYEAVTDAVAQGLSETEIVALMVAIAVATVGLFLGLVIEALVWALYALFLAFIEIAEFMTIDLWDATFTEMLTCVLYNCAADNGNVITFDWQCVNDGIATTVDLNNANALDQLRLFGQVSFMLSVIGVDGLNAAGATTAITAYDCDGCGVWCYEWDLTQGLGGWTLVWGVATVGGIEAANDVANSTRRATISMTFPADIQITKMEMVFSAMAGNTPNYQYATMILYNPPDPQWRVDANYSGTVTDVLFTNVPAPQDGGYVAESMLVSLMVDAAAGGYTGWGYIKTVRLFGNGENPFGEDNCE